MTKPIDYEKTECRLRIMGVHSLQVDRDWCRDGADAIAALLAEVKRLKEEDARLRKACAHEDNEIQQVLGRALGYPRYCDDQASFPGATDADGVCVGEHVAVTLAKEAAKRIVSLSSRRLVATAVIVEDLAGRVLLLKRGSEGTWPGQWCLPGGGLKQGETIQECAQRELSEETGLHAYSLELECVTDCDGLIGLVFLATAISGTPVNAEPHRHDQIGWFGLHELPSPLMPGVVQWLESERPGWLVKSSEQPAPKVVKAEWGETYMRPEFTIEPDEGDI